MVEAIDSHKNFELDLLRSLWTLKFAWDEVTAKTISNCFHHAKFLANEMDEVDDLDNVDDNADVTIQSQWALLVAKGRVDETYYNFSDFIDVDRDLCTTGAFSTQHTTKTRQQEEESDDDDNVESPIITLQDAGKAVEIFEKFLEQNGTSKAMELAEKMKKCFEDIRLQRSLQSKITDFFT